MANSRQWSDPMARRDAVRSGAFPSAARPLRSPGWCRRAPTAVHPHPRPLAAGEDRVRQGLQAPRQGPHRRAQRRPQERCVPRVGAPAARPSEPSLAPRCSAIDAIVTPRPSAAAAAARRGHAYPGRCAHPRRQGWSSQGHLPARSPGQTHRLVSAARRRRPPPPAGMWGLRSNIWRRRGPALPPDSPGAKRQPSGSPLSPSGNRSNLSGAAAGPGPAAAAASFMLERTALDATAEPGNLVRARAAAPGDPGPRPPTCFRLSPPRSPRSPRPLRSARPHRPLPPRPPAQLLALHVNTLPRLQDIGEGVVRVHISVRTLPEPPPLSPPRGARAAASRSRAAPPGARPASRGGRASPRGDQSARSACVPRRSRRTSPRCSPAPTSSARRWLRCAARAARPSPAPSPACRAPAAPGTRGRCPTPDPIPAPAAGVPQRRLPLPPGLRLRPRAPPHQHRAEGAPHAAPDPRQRAPGARRPSWG